MELRNLYNISENKIEVIEELVSGEYSMIKRLAAKGWINSEREVIEELVAAIRRVLKEHDDGAIELSTIELIDSNNGWQFTFEEICPRENKIVSQRYHDLVFFLE